MLYRIILILLLFSTSVFAQEQLENQIIDRIDIILPTVGKSIDANSILARMKSRKGDLFSQNEFDNDLKRLSQDFDYIEPTFESIDGRLQITLRISPKPLIRNITYSGNLKVKRKALQDELGIVRGTVFDRLSFNQAFIKLRTLYVSKGFFEAELSYEIMPIADSGEVDIHISIQERRAGRIKNIQFVNFTPSETSAILDMMGTKEYNFFLSWLTDEGTYREEMVQQDELIILNYFQNLGYADARVHIEVTELPECPNRINLVISVEHGPLYRFGCFSIEGNTLFTEDQVKRCFLIREGRPYAPERIRETLTRITNLYGKYGYIDAVADYELNLVEGEYAYDVKFTVEEDCQYRIGMIKLFGNSLTHADVILHETLLIPGEVFNLEKLRKTEMRLLNIGYFKCVNVYAVKSDGPSVLGEEYRDVHIEVEETSTGQIGANFGFSTSENLFGGLNLTENNFNSAGLRCLFKNGLCGLRGGGEFFSLSATFGTKSRSYLLSWSKPFFMDTKWTVGFDLERASNRYVSNAYDIETTSFTIKGMRMLNQFMRFGLHYRIKNTHLAHIHKGSPELRKEKRHSGLLSGVGASWIYDSTNHPINPTDGFKSKVESEIVGLQGNHGFVSLCYLNTSFFQLPWWDKCGVWKVRGDLQFIQPLPNTDFDDIPLDEHYFLGGDHLVRGYRPYWLGPKFRFRDQHGHHHKTDPKGGISLQFLSVEYCRPIWKVVDGFTFIEGGYVSDHPWRFGRLNVAAGFGVKLYVFAGAPPLMIGLGFPINPRHKRDVKHFFMTVGGRF